MANGRNKATARDMSNNSDALGPGCSLVVQGLQPGLHVEATLLA